MKYDGLGEQIEDIYEYNKRSKKETIFKNNSKSFKYPEQFWTLDTEDDSKGNLKIIAIVRNDLKIKESFCGENKFELRTQIENFILKNKIKIIYAHNLTYDLNNIFGIDWLWFKPVFRNSSCLQCTLNQGKLKTKFKDSTALLPMKLKDVGKLFGEHKKEVNEKFLDVDYCIQDCIVLATGLNKFIDVLKANKIPMKLTLPSIFVSKFKTEIAHNIGKCNGYIDFVRHAYKGGRCEVFKTGKVENINVYDVNSLYPFCMLGRFPCPEFAFRSKIFVDPKDKFQVLDCIIEQNEKIPALGIKHDGKYIFPNGIIRGFFTNVELDYAIKNTNVKILEINDSLVFEWGEKYFEKLVLKLSKLKENAKLKHEKKIFKIIQNGGYGKFAQNNKVIIFDEDKEKIVEVEKEYPEYSNYVWSILVSAKARILMHKIMNKHKENLAYSDTDSIHLINNDTIDENDIDPNKLGKFKHVGFFKRGEHKQAKMYKLLSKGKYIYTCKGIPAKYQKEYFETGKTKFQKPVKIKTFLRDQSKKLNFWKYIEKAQKTHFDKRIMLEDGNTEPVRLDYYSDVQEAKEKYISQFQKTKKKLNVNRNRCIICGCFISKFRDFCEFHEPSNVGF